MADGNRAPIRRKPRVDAEARRRTYVDIAATVLLEKGLHAATMRDIAEAAGAAKVLFYRLFPSRDALVEAVFQRVETAITAAYDEPWDGYGSMVRRVLEAARLDPPPFLVVLKNCRGGPELNEWESRLRTLFTVRTLPMFTPEPGAPTDADERATLAAGTLFGLFVESMISWLEERDGLDDATRILWWGRIVREWRAATREAFRLDATR